MLTVSVVSTTGRDSVVIHNGRKIATVPPSGGKAIIAASKLGKGTITLQAVQEQDGRTVLRSRPVDVEVH
ncbi:MAG: hypothetical protein DCC67_05455 [Planctomycetota bacterium]|nr:MAG: hypothetical protein DCC67_05455 [Planctomycetota bacterium]